MTRGIIPGLQESSNPTANAQDSGTRRAVPHS